MPETSNVIIITAIFSIVFLVVIIHLGRYWPKSFPSFSVFTCPQGDGYKIIAPFGEKHYSQHFFDIFTIAHFGIGALIGMFLFKIGFGLVSTLIIVGIISVVFELIENHRFVLQMRANLGGGFGDSVPNVIGDQIFAMLGGVLVFYIGWTWTKWIGITSLIIPFAIAIYVRYLSTIKKGLPLTLRNLIGWAV